MSVLHPMVPFKIRWFMCLCWMISCLSCGPTPTTPYFPLVTGGREVGKESKLPTRWATVALTTKTLAAEERAYCTGVLIKPTIVLTAAHCITDDNGHFTTLGHVSFGPKVGIHPVTLNKMVGLAVHKFWNPAALDRGDNVAYNDLALVKMNAAFTKAMPMGITTGEPRLGYQDSVVIAGYGVSASRDLDDTGLLRSVSMKVKSVNPDTKSLLLEGLPRDGYALWPYGFSDTKRKRIRSGACAGDSGGPAFTRGPTAKEWLLVGITSFGYEFEKEGEREGQTYCVGQNGYTYLAPYRRQIEKAAVQLERVTTTQTNHRFFFSEDGLTPAP